MKKRTIITSLLLVFHIFGSDQSLSPYASQVSSERSDASLAKLAEAQLEEMEGAHRIPKPQSTLSATYYLAQLAELQTKITSHMQLFHTLNQRQTELSKQIASCEKEIGNLAIESSTLQLELQKSIEQHKRLIKRTGFRLLWAAFIEKRIEKSENALNATEHLSNSAGTSIVQPNLDAARNILIHTIAWRKTHLDEMLQLAKLGLLKSTKNKEFIKITLNDFTLTKMRKNDTETHFNNLIQQCDTISLTIQTIQNNLQILQTEEKQAATYVAQFLKSHHPDLVPDQKTPSQIFIETAQASLQSAYDTLTNSEIYTPVVDATYAVASFIGTTFYNKFIAIPPQQKNTITKSTRKDGQMDIKEDAESNSPFN